MLRELYLYSDKSSQETCNTKTDLFHRLSLEELHIRSASPAEMPVVLELALNPETQNFQITSSKFLILNLRCQLVIIGFKHNSSIEVFITFMVKEPKDCIFSISFEVWIGKNRSFVILPVNLTVKTTYSLGKFKDNVPNALILKAQYEKIHSLMINELLEIRPEMVEETLGLLTYDRFILIIASDNLRTNNEDEVMAIIGSWTNNNSCSEEEITQILKYVRKKYLSLNGLLDISKYPILKSSNAFKSFFKQELLNLSGVNNDAKPVKPRILYKMNPQAPSFNSFCDSIMNHFFPVENNKDIEQKVGKFIENSAKAKKLKKKVESLQSSLNSTVHLNSSTPCAQVLEIQTIPESPVVQETHDFIERRPALTPNLYKSSKIPAKLSISILRRKLKRHSVDLS